MDAPYAKLRLPEPVVIPESIDQCIELLGSENVVGLGDFARDAGFDESVLVTPEALQAMLGSRMDRWPPSELPNVVTDALRELLDQIRAYPGRQTLVVRDRTEDGMLVDVLVRRNLGAVPPFTVVTLS
ncbi:MAG: hypothetical protein ACF8Q5_06030 [Phycisphaerales bacterium JB040]